MEQGPYSCVAYYYISIVEYAPVYCISKIPKKTRVSFQYALRERQFYFYTGLSGVGGWVCVYIYFFLIQHPVLPEKKNNTNTRANAILYSLFAKTRIKRQTRRGSKKKKSRPENLNSDDLSKTTERITNKKSQVKLLREMRLLAPSAILSVPKSFRRNA